MALRNLLCAAKQPADLTWCTRGGGRRMHPDTGGTDGMAMLLNEAREVLLRRVV